jgi:alkanesulfonate monooxygenase SsuD/methylene tetrahydromethanopterin reductase-like flavin-dependent oxidoreductase (luciferase family)
VRTDHNASLLERTSAFVFPWARSRTSLEGMRDFAICADQLGIGAVHLPYFTHLPAEHFGFESWENREILNPLTVAPVIARVTSRVQIGVSHWHFGLFHPFVWAQYIASLDVVSSGRAMALPTVRPYPLDLQIGRSRQEEVTARALEGTELLCRWFAGARTSAEDSKCWDTAGLALNPTPGGDVPIWVHGADDLALERAGRWGGPVKVHGTPPHEVATQLTPRIDAAARKYRRPLSLYLTVAVWVSDPTDDESNSTAEVHEMSESIGPLHFHSGRNIIVGSSDQVASALWALLEAGASGFVVDFNFHGWASEEFGMEQMRRYAERVAPLVDANIKSW